jgi:hypothetical protein
MALADYSNLRWLFEGSDADWKKALAESKLIAQGKEALKSGSYTPTERMITNPLTGGLEFLNVDPRYARQTSAKLANVVGAAPVMGAEGGDIFGRAVANQDPLSMAGGVGLAALGTIGGAGGKGKTTIQDVLRTIETPKDVNVPARFLSGEKAGNYRGTEAFGGINPQQLGKMRAEYLNKMEKGVGGRNWYDESSADISRWVGGNPTEADKVANMLAITSAETPVASNLMYTNKGWNQYLTGAPINTGKRPERMGKEISAIMDNPEAAATGLKRSPFSAGLSVDWRGAEFANRPTHDIHDVRAWGITDPKTGDVWKKGVGEAGHRFLDEQAQWVTDQALKNNLGGVSDWNPYRSQAAAWIAQKAEREGKPIAETAKHYGSYAPNYQGVIPREWIAGENTGHLPELLNAPESVKKAYSQAMEKNITGSQGIDQLARDIGALSDRTIPNVGFYEGDFNPAYMSKIGVGKSTGSQSIDPASENVMKAITASHGLLGTQKQAAWNYLGGEVPIKEAGGIKLLGNNLNDSQFKEFTKKVQGIGGDIPMYDPEGGIRLLSFASPEEKTAFAKKLKPLAQEYGLTPSYHQLSGDIYPFEPTKQWSSKPYIKAIEESGLEKQTSSALQKHAGNLLNTASDFASKNNLTEAKWFKPMMEGLRDGGLPKLKELVNAGVVPAFMYVNLSKEEKKK